MKLPVQLVESFDDDQLNFEALQGILTTPGAALPFLQTLSAQELQLAFGSSTVTFSASNTSATTTVTHNLGRTPVFAAGVGLTTGNVWYTLQTRGATTVGFQGNYYTSATGTFSFLWIAIG